MYSGLWHALSTAALVLEARPLACVSAHLRAGPRENAYKGEVREQSRPSSLIPIASARTPLHSGHPATSSMSEYALNVRIDPAALPILIKAGYKLCIAKKVNNSYSVIWQGSE